MAIEFRLASCGRVPGVRDEDSQFGAYGYRPPKLGLVDEVGAGLVVYFTVMAGWATLAVGAIRRIYDTGVGVYVAIAILYVVFLMIALWNRDRLVYRSPVH